MSSDQLRWLSARALSASLASPLLLTGCGCGGISLEGYSLPTCDDGSPSVGGRSPAAQTDFVELRLVADLYTTPREQPLASSGRPCETATQPVACNAELEALSSEEGFRSRCEPGCYS
ncbi:hypothetical protein [Myxococcus sp. AM010]|uniref:hypothetical protein n=1 Tax=Myxococcus sp. AM010 TaxID=2745138 RepID=UPI0020D0F8DB|nr:hypothetical protein [Myxococcus sp. AM010]